MYECDCVVDGKWSASRIHLLLFVIHMAQVYLQVDDNEKYKPALSSVVASTLFVLVTIKPPG